MTEEQLREVFQFADKRDETVYAWLRYLIGLASGALAILASLQNHQEHGVAGIAQKVSWTALGLGILLGALRAYGEVWTAREIVRRLVAERKRQSTSGDTNVLPIIAAAPRILIWCEWACYGSLILAVISLVVFALTRC